MRQYVQLQLTKSAYPVFKVNGRRCMVAKPSPITFGVLSGPVALFWLGAWVHESVIIDGDVLLDRVKLNR